MGGGSRRDVSTTACWESRAAPLRSATRSRSAAAAPSAARWWSPDGRAMSPIRSSPTIRSATLVALIGALTAEPLDQGSAHFDAVQSGVHLGRCRQRDASISSRRSTRALQHPFQRSPQPELAQDAGRAARRGGGGRPGRLAHRLGAVERRRVSARAGAIPRSCRRCDQAGRPGQTPQLSTTGGTSDARFIKNYCPVIEFGLVGTDHAPGGRSARRSPT